MFILYRNNNTLELFYIKTQIMIEQKLEILLYLVIILHFYCLKAYVNI